MDRIVGKDFKEMFIGGYVNLLKHEEEVNNLNVFPIPDGDTGINMRLTMQGGVENLKNSSEDLSKICQNIENGILLGARGNSGVILSQFFRGICSSIKDKLEVELVDFISALNYGVKLAYQSVKEPTEGTILTVAREGVLAVKNSKNFIELFDIMLNAMTLSLNNTPNLLSVLKDAGVIDSGGQGLVYIVQGMLSILKGESIESSDITLATSENSNTKSTIELNGFNEDSVLEYGYCTEFLLQLQNSKIDANNFDEQIIANYLSTIGNSIVVFKTGTIVKVHVHTFTPGKVYEYCQQFGEFLTLKTENMMLQHNGSSVKNLTSKKKEHKNIATVCVASGVGIEKAFLNLNADIVINVGKNMNPSVNDFIKEIDKIDADNVIIFPNNSNVILTANQVKEQYTKANIEVIETKTIAEGYACMQMFDNTLSLNEVIEILNDSKNSALTLSVSSAVRNSQLNNVQINKGDYVGIINGEIVASCKDINSTIEEMFDKVDFIDKSVIIGFTGKSSIKNNEEYIKSNIFKKYRGVESYLISGEQDIYDYIFLVE